MPRLTLGLLSPSLYPTLISPPLYSLLSALLLFRSKPIRPIRWLTAMKTQAAPRAGGYLYLDD